MILQKNPHYRGNYRGYRKNTAVTITVSLSNSDCVSEFFLMSLIIIIYLVT